MIRAYFDIALFALLVIHEIYKRWNFEKKEKAYKDPDYISLYRSYSNFRLMVFVLGLIFFIAEHFEK